MGGTLLSTGAARLFAGQAALFACMLVYLAWWCAFFRPARLREGRAQGFLGAAGVALAALLGAAGIALCVAGMAGLPTASASDWWFAAGGAVALAACYALTVVALRRPPTLELPIVVGWTALQCACASALGQAGLLGPLAALAFTVAALALFAVSMVCYVRYFDLSGWASTAAGMLPLAGGALYAAAVCLALAPAVFG